VLAAGLLLWLADPALLNAGAVVEARGGQAPLLPGEAPRAAVASVVTPAAMLELDNPGTTFQLQYRPRLFWRYPNISDETRPLVWHTLEATFIDRLSHTLEWRARGSGSVGELDYSALRTIVGPGQSALPQVTRYLQSEAGTQVLWQPSRAWRLDQTLSGLYRRPLDSTALPAVTPAPGLPTDGAPPPPPEATAAPAAEAPHFVLPREAVVDWLARAAYSVTARGQLVLFEDLSYHDLSTGMRILAFIPALGWRQTFGSMHALTALGGAAITPQLHAGRTGAPAPSLVSPVGDLAWDTRAEGALDDRGFELHLELAVDWYLDPVLERGSPRGRALASVGRPIGRDWLVRLDGGFATELTAEPYPGEPDQTVVSAAVPVRYRVSPQLAVEAGVRYSNRGPHLAAPDFKLHQREIWGFVSITALALPPPTATRTPPPATPPTVPGR
jgi:hypothetical protein